MVRATFAVLCLLVAGCTTPLWRWDDYPSGALCGDGDACPPGQVCRVEGNAKLCRTACAHPGHCQSGQSCECQNNSNGPNGGEQCDLDSFCRGPSCNGGSGNLGAQCGMMNGGGCPSGMVCDFDFDLCRTICTGATPCPPGFDCVALAGNTGCMACRIHVMGGPCGQPGGTCCAGSACNDGGCCFSGHCVENGGTCSGASACVSGTCI